MLRRRLNMSAIRRRRKNAFRSGTTARAVSSPIRARFRRAISCVGSSGSLDGAVNSSTATAGDGETKRSEDLELSIAAVVVEVLGNGNLVIQGSQEVRVNAELRVLTIGGIVRPIDIGPQNTISYERNAEARISYGGRGRLTEVQQPPYGQQILDRVLPF